MQTADIRDLEDKSLPVYTIDVAAKLVGATVQTLRLYEKHGFVDPARGFRNRLYSGNDIRLLMCIREMVHLKKYSLEAVKKLFGYAACWEIRECPEEKRFDCFVFRDSTSLVFSQSGRTSAHR